MEIDNVNDGKRLEITVFVPCTSGSVSCNDEAANPKITGIEGRNQVGILMPERSQNNAFRFSDHDE